jgi:hypothetical protein
MNTERATSLKLKVTSYKSVTFNFQPSTFDSSVSFASFAVSPNEPAPRPDAC